LNLAMKQRLVGTLVLGSLALIIIPLLLDGEGIESPPLTLSIPPAPQVNTSPIPDPVRPIILADQTDAQASSSSTAGEEVADTESAFTAVSAEPETATADTTAAAAAASTENTAATSSTVQESPIATPAAARSETAPARDAQGLPEAWSVRLGVFADRANAEALEARLLAAGHKAYLQPVRTGQGSMNGVFVGPVLTKREADALQQQLAAAFPQEPGIVQQFRIEP